MKKLFKFLKDEEGIEFVEWALMCAGFALVVVAFLGTVTGALQTTYNNIAAKLTALPGGGGS